jgi:hypothetical protein
MKKTKLSSDWFQTKKHSNEHKKTNVISFNIHIYHGIVVEEGNICL